MSGIAVLDQKYLASCSYDKTINIWEINTGNLAKTLRGHLDWIYSLTVLNNGNLASSSLDNSIKIWNVNEGNCVLT